MGVFFVFVIVTGVGATPPPTIITTQTSPICTALREKIAPAIDALMVEDNLMAKQRPAVTSGYMIAQLASNWIYVDKLLNPDTFFHSTNADDVRRMEALRERLQAVADDENSAINVLSGAKATYEFEALLGQAPFVPSPLVADLVSPDGTPAILHASTALEDEFLRRRAHIRQAEALIYSVLTPVVSQCK